MTPRFFFVAVLAAGLGLLPGAGACADEAQTSEHAAAQPWEKDQAFLTETEKAVQSGGILAVAPRTAALEAALDGAQFIVVSGDTTYVLTDGPGEALIAMMTMATDKSRKGGKSVAVANPYPAIALYLGSYYDEVGKSADALRVVDKGLTSSAVSDLKLGEHRPFLIAERGAALNALKRWADALANYDEGLAGEDLAPNIRAIMDRGRGFSLTELGRLDEAEAAYRDSLKLEPGNAIAENELKYIAQLKAGGAKEPTGLKSVQPQPGTDGSGGEPPT